MSDNISVTINTDEQQKKTTDVPAICQKAEIIISNQSEYENASVVLKEIKSRYKELDTQRKEITTPLDTAKKQVMELFRKPLEMLDKAESLIKNKMIGYTTEQERKAEEERRRLQRLADEEAARQKKILDEKIARAKASGKEEKAGMLEERKENVVPVFVPTIAPSIEKPSGVSYRDKWYAVVVNPDLIPREYLIPNMDALNKIATGTKGSLKIPGVEFKSEKILSSRSA